jgi:PPOX class probable F420-dependent enzyme
MVAEFDDVYRSKFIVLTTFTKDGRPKPTAVQGTPDDGKLLVFTGRDSWKVKRIRNNPHVTVAAGSRRGSALSEAADAVAVVLPESETERVYRTRLKQAGPIGALLYRIFTKLDGGLDHRVALQITPEPTG